MPKKRTKSDRRGTVIGILGVGLDDADGHKRITRTELMILVGGSKQTHDRMQETASRFAESLEKQGKTLNDVSAREVADLIRAAHEKAR